MGLVQTSSYVLTITEPFHGTFHLQKSCISRNPLTPAELGRGRAVQGSQKHPEEGQHSPKSWPSTLQARGEAAAGPECRTFSPKARSSPWSDKGVTKVQLLMERTHLRDGKCLFSQEKKKKKKVHGKRGGKDERSQQDPAELLWKRSFVTGFLA